MNQDDQIKQRLQNIEAPAERAGFDADVRALLKAKPAPQEITSSRSNHKRTVWLASPFAAAAAVIAVVLVSQSLDSSPKPSNQVAAPPTTATSTPETTELKPLLASAVLAKANSLSETVQSLSGTIDQTNHPFKYWWGGEDPGSVQNGQVFKVDANGDSYLSAPASGDLPASLEWYRPSVNTYVQCLNSEGWSCTTNTSANPADQLSIALLTQTSKLRAAVADDSVPVQEVTFDSRSAWKLSLSNPAAKGVDYQPEASTVIIDQESGFPLSLSTIRDGKPFQDFVVHNLNVNPKFATSDFLAALPKGATNDSTSSGFAQVSLAKVTTLAGYAPITPSVVPDGYKLTQVSFANSSSYAGWKGADEYGAKIVSLTYRYGLSSFLVSTRLSGPKGTDWTVNPDGISENQDLDPRVTLTEGAFKDVTARYTAASTTGELWGVGPKYVFAITGDLNADQLLAVAQSMH